MRSPLHVWMVPALLLACALPLAPRSDHERSPWKRHTIDDTSRGADGVRIADANGDGLLDIATGWEEGGVIRVYLHPGHARVRGRWPAVTVGTVGSPEDAVFADLDGDGSMDVVSSCEGETRSLFVHWAPSDRSQYLDPSAWKTEPMPATRNGTMWMYALPLDVDGRHGLDLVVGSKGAGAMIGWLEAPANPRDLGAWRLHRLRGAGWIMSLIAADLDGDGDEDIVASDRKGDLRGALWLEHPGRSRAREPGAWKPHRIGAGGEEIMFIDLVDANRDGRLDVIAPVKPNRILTLLSPPDPRGPWKASEFEYPLNRFGTTKAVRLADIDGDGRDEWIVTCEGASGGKSGVFRIADTAPSGGVSRSWLDMAGPAGVKYDRIELVDMDGDGDLDVLTCEETDNLGVIWYENPRR